MAAAGRLLVIDTVGLIKVKRYESGNAIASWLQANAYRVEHDHFQELQPTYAPEHPADFYFILPPSRASQADEVALSIARERLGERITFTKSLVYPFNRKEWALKEWDLHED